MTFMLNGLLGLLVLLYPLAVYYGLQRWDTRTIAIVLILVMVMRGAFALGTKSAMGRNTLWLVIAAIVILTLVFVFNEIIYFKFYPVIVNVSLFTLFASTLWKPPSMIERLARIKEPDLPDAAISYTRKVTQLWCLFFIVSGSISLFTACCTSLEIWTLYNGLISYVLIGLLFAAEWLVRQTVRK